MDIDLYNIYNINKKQTMKHQHEEYDLRSLLVNDDEDNVIPRKKLNDYFNDKIPYSKIAKYRIPWYISLPESYLEKLMNDRRDYKIKILLEG